MFLGKFETLAATPSAVEKLRELVLALAVAAGQQDGRGTCPTRPLKELASKIGSGATPLGGRETYLANGVPLIRSMNVYYRGFQSEGLVYLSDQQAEALSNVEVQSGDVLLNITGASIGRVTIAPPEMAGARVNQHVMIIRPLATISNRFLTMFLASPTMQRMINEMEVGATRQALTKGMVENFAIPVPPLDEQKRIVAKVDELMALCDRLEAQQQEREYAHAVFTRAALARFADAPTAENVEHLFHRAVSVDPADLRQLLLKLATMGGLGTQNSDDEPASSFLPSLHDKLPADKRRRVPDPLPAPSEVPHAVPGGWAWARFQEIAFIASNLVSPSAYLDAIHLAPDNIEKGTGVLLPCRTVREDEVKSGNHRFFPGQIVYSKIRPNLSKAVLVDFGGLCSADMYPIDPLIEPRYLLYYILSETFRRQSIRTDTRVAMPKINQGELNAILVPVPPLEEQRRIVAKVNDLMVLVDRLEADLAAARDTGERLMDAVVAELGTRS